MKRIASLILALALIQPLSGPVLSEAATPEVQALVDLLVSKNVLTQADAQNVIKESEQLVLKQKEEMTAEVQKASGLPEWVTNTTFKGDLRLRYQYERQDVAGDVARHRERLRFRWGFETKITDTLKVGARFASGGTAANSARSTNQTFTGAFSTKDFSLDTAYFIWMPNEFANFTGGKFDKAFFYPTDLLWDSDITFEGQAFQLNAPFGEGSKGFLNGGFFMLEEEDPAVSDSFMWVAQPGVEVAVSDSLKLTAASAFYFFGGMEGATRLGGTASSNTVNSVGDLTYNPDSINPNITLDYKWKDDNGKEWAAKLTGDSVFNYQTSDYGYLFGGKIGDSKIAAFGQWQLGYNYRYLQANSFLDIFPDSDAYGGATNVGGHEITLDYGLTKNTYLSLDYYNMYRTNGRAAVENLLQADLNIKF